MSEHVLGTESLDTLTLGLGGEPGLLLLISTDALVHFLKSETGFPDLRVLVVVLRGEKLVNARRDGKRERERERTYHGSVAEISGVSNILVLVQQVLQEGDTSIEVHIDLISEFLRAS